MWLVIEIAWEWDAVKPISLAATLEEAEDMASDLRGMKDENWNGHYAVVELAYKSA